MAKRKKINWFWHSQEDTEQFPNSVKQHEAKIVKHYDKNGNEIAPKGAKSLFDEDGNWNDYGDDWGRSWKEDKKTKKSPYYDWSEYEKTGVWKGYQQPKSATLSYSYIQQMANAIANEHNVKVEVGRSWSIDLPNKTLTYNPTTMMFGSKGELLATLLHEVGKIRLCTPIQELKSAWYKPEWKQFAYLATTIFDDFRVDSVMIDSYPSADEVYESQEGTLLRVVADYEELSKEYGKSIRQSLKDKTDYVMMLIQDPRVSGFAQAFQLVFGTLPPAHLKTRDDFVKEVTKLRNSGETNIYDYISVVVYKGYGLKSTTVKTSKEQDDLFALTSGGVEKSIKEKTTQGVLDMMDTEVFPHIKHLLESMTNGSKEMQEALGEDAAKDIMKSANERMRERGGMENPTTDKNNEMKARGQGRGEVSLPKEWLDGDYESLKDSVSSEISSLVRKMTNLRRKENVIRYENNHRRGKLNSKVLYRHRLGSNRLFKKKQDKVDTIRSFVFSIAVDISGSMFTGENKTRIVHTIRSLIMLTEVFTKLEMPFEVNFFDNDNHSMKTFDGKYDKATKRRIAGVIQGDGGGTSLSAALESTKIASREELNRVQIVLTDGLCEDNEYLDTTYFKPLAQKNIKAIVIGLECGDEIKRLNMGQGIAVDNAAKMPEEFYRLLSSTVLKK